MGAALELPVQPLQAVGGLEVLVAPARLRQMGFNRRQVNDGGYAGAGRTPFDEEAPADFFASIDLDRLWAFQQSKRPSWR